MAVGIAILQYRLWDLDVVVKKALVAGALVVLALARLRGPRSPCSASRPPADRAPEPCS